MTMADQASRFGQPEKICDIVLKGGITSGVVYPLALVSLAEKYRFSNIGGTSAGAVAAVAAAAAEYGRQTEAAGFDRLARIPDEVGSGLLSMFQPTPALKPLFDIFVAALKAKTKMGRTIAITGAVVGGYWLSALLGLLPGLVVALIAPAIGGGTGFVAFGLLLALTGLVAAVIWRLVKAANTDLVDNDFGLCPGIRQPDFSKEGFTDWLARLIDEAAGNKTGRPAQWSPAYSAGHDDDQPDGEAPVYFAHAGRPPLRLRKKRMGPNLSQRRHGISEQGMRAVHASRRRGRRILSFPRSGAAAADRRRPDEPEFSVADFRRAAMAS